MFCRILCDGSGAEWPLSRKFGCAPDMAGRVLEHAHRLGLVAYGLSFHVGSQQRNPRMWDGALAASAAIFKDLAERGIALQMVNLGGGFPTKYLKSVPAVRQYGEAIFEALRRHFGNRIPETIIEPGRGMVGNAGMIEAEVVLVSKKSDEDRMRWVYLDIGKFNGLAETMDEMIRYPIRTEFDGDATEPCIIAGPTCDSVDVLYEKEPYELAGVAGDRLQGADRGNGRLYDDLFGRRLQRLSAAEVLRHLKRGPAVWPGVASTGTVPAAFSWAAGPARVDKRTPSDGHSSFPRLHGRRSPEPCRPGLPPARRAAAGRSRARRAARRQLRPLALRQDLRAPARRRAPAEGLSLVALGRRAVVGTLRFWHVECGRCRPYAGAAGGRPPAIARPASAAR